MEKREAQCPIEEATWSSEKEKELRSLRKETKTFKQTMMTLLQGQDQKEDENSKLKKKTEQLERNYLKKANEFDNLSTEMQECREKLKENERKLKEKTEQLERNYLKKANEFDNLSTEMQECREKLKENERLSKIAGIQLTKGNSEIADLSDANRPTKLGEKWSSLYADEWSKAYDEITMKRTIKDENYRVEKELFEMVKKCYTTCVELERKQMTDIKMHAWDIACCLHQQPDQLVEAAQTTLYFKMEEDKKTNYLKMTKVEENKKAAAQVSNQKPNAEDMLKLRAIQNCMKELIQIVHERREYDKKLLEYVMQEALGELEQYNKMRSKSQILKFVERCTELCWSMVIKEPPMALVFNEMEGTAIDKNIFSVYTKNGPFIDFVVWPALLLHKDGPILTKGTVQGKENDTIKIEISNSTDEITEKAMDTPNEIAHYDDDNFKYIPPDQNSPDGHVIEDDGKTFTGH